MSFVSKQKDKAVIKVPGAYMFTICPKVEAELKDCLKRGCQKVQVDLEKTEVLTSAAIRQLAGFCRLVEEENFGLYNATGWVLGTVKANNLERWMKAV
ncbi:hypothetical protein [Selenomonas sp. AB3002]|uniref:hypothetical protein n=1 Tax=Selenomonas sp. AB3002 TaxID=1392502 RepID=UPI00049852B6